MCSNGHLDRSRWGGSELLGGGLHSLSALVVDAVDQKKDVFLVLLDLSAAFDRVVHDILLDFL